MDLFEVPTHKFNVRPDNIVLHFSILIVDTWILNRPIGRFLPSQYDEVRGIRDEDTHKGVIIITNHGHEGMLEGSNGRSIVRL